MTYDLRINIIYSHLDNVPSPAIENNLWVDSFIKFFRIMLEQILGSEIKMQRLSAIEELTRDEKNIFIPILSKKFLEEENLVAVAKQLMQDELLVNRTFVVVKQAVEGDILSRFRNYHLNRPATQKNGDSTNRTTNDGFWLNLADLAYDIHALVSRKAAFNKINISEKPGIFLAESTEGLSTERRNLKRDLENWGFVVFPDHTQVLDEIEFSNQISKYLSQSEYSIHLVNGSFTDSDEIVKTKETLQIDLAVQYARAHNGIAVNDDDEFRIFIWSDKFEIYGLSDKNRKDMFARLQQVNEVEIVKTPFEEFKNYVKSRIIRKPSPEAELQQTYIKGTETLKFFILFDKPDEQTAQVFVKHLRNRGFSVFTTIFDSDLMAVRHIHQESLRRFDVAIILAVQTNLNWLNIKILEILKAPGLGRAKPIVKKLLIASESILQLLPTTAAGFDVISFAGNPTLEILDEHINLTLK